MTPFKQLTQQTLQIEAEALLKATEFITDEIDEAIELIDHCQGKLIITGVGKSGHIGAKMAATFASTGTSSFFVHPTEAMHGDLGMIDKNDVVLAISFSGESEELSAILPHLQRFDVPIIAMTRSKTSTLGASANVTIPLHIEKEACPLGVAPTTSTTLTLALGDALAVSMMIKRDFQKEDFASFHPGGSLGKQLFVKVADLMQTENLPIVSPTTTLKEAIPVMSSARLGTLLIVKDDQLIATMSDGDIRRALMDDDFSLDQSVSTYANQNPITINNATMLASQALELIEEHKIQILVVTDHNRNIAGVLHLHTLVEMGIK
jgi:arabinose-5-phosphate isomerase